MKHEIELIGVTTVCPFCGEEHTVIVDIEGFFKWQDGALVQDVFSYLSADERELLISGICPECFPSN